MDAKDKIADTNTNSAARLEQEDSRRIDDAVQAQSDDTTISQQAAKEAARLGGDAYLVKTDLEEADLSEGVENEDGSISALANSGNQER